MRYTMKMSHIFIIMLKYIGEWVIFRILKNQLQGTMKYMDSMMESRRENILNL